MKQEEPLSSYLVFETESSEGTSTYRVEIADLMARYSRQPLPSVRRHMLSEALVGLPVEQQRRLIMLDEDADL